MIFDRPDPCTCEWLDPEAPMSPWVLSTRIRLARNLSGYPFSQWASTVQVDEIIEQSRAALEQTSFGAGLEFLKIDQTDPVNLEFLRERHLISREMTQGHIRRMVALTEDGNISVMIGEEDHLRVQVLKPGLDLQPAWEQVSSLDQQLQQKLEFASSPQLGYLTVCPTNVGTGMRCSVMLHLPALVMTKQIEKVLNAVKDQTFTIRGSLGEGSEIKGAVFQISNQITLGITEQEILATIPQLTQDVVTCEQEAQQQLLTKTRVVLEDKVWRALGILREARVIDHQEAIDLISTVRLGISCGLLENMSLKTINEMLVCTRPAHIQKYHGRKMKGLQRDIYRAEFIRQQLNGGLAKNTE